MVLLTAMCLATQINGRLIHDETVYLVWKMAGRPGFEPGLTGSEPVVLPLNYLPSGGASPLCKLTMKMAGRPGFEPGLTGSEPVVLPLNYLPSGVCWRGSSLISLTVQGVKESFSFILRDASPHWPERPRQSATCPQALSPIPVLPPTH